MFKKFIIFVLIFTICTCTCFGLEKKQTKKPVSKSTSQENKIRKIMYNQCKTSGISPSRCYQLYY